MRLYLTAETSIPDLYIDYIEVLLKSGEEVSLNWDYSDIERTPSGFSARYKGVYIFSPFCRRIYVIFGAP